MKVLAAGLFCTLIAMLSLPEKSCSGKEPHNATAKGEKNTPPNELPAAARVAISREIARLRSMSTKDVVVTAAAQGCKEVTGPSLRLLFPHHVFVRIPYDYNRAPGSNAGVARPAGLYETLAVNRDNGDPTRLTLGNMDDFGSFLAAQHVTLKTDKDASLIWDALCEAHALKWHHGKHFERSKHIWRLDWEIKPGIANEKLEYFYEVVTGDDGIVLTGQLKSEVVAAEKGER